MTGSKRRGQTPGNRNERDAEVAGGAHYATLGLETDFSETPGAGWPHRSSLRSINEQYW